MLQNCRPCTGPSQCCVLVGHPLPRSLPSCTRAHPQRGWKARSSLGLPALPRHHARAFTAVCSATPAPDELAPTSGVPGTNNLPRTPLEMVQQASDCVSAGIAAGMLRQTVDFLLPINEKARNFLSSEAEDYPCSLQEEFQVVSSLTTSLLQRVLGDPTASILVRRLDDGGVEGEPCAVLYPDSAGPHKGAIAAVVYPTAERLSQLKELAKVADRPLLIVNPQWREEGQVISDFGIGPWRKSALEFLGQFGPTYSLKEKRIGSPGTIDAATGTRFANGGVIRVLLQGQGQWECYATSADGSSQMLDTAATEPRYNELDSMILDGRKRNLPIFRIARLATYVYADNPDNGPGSDDPSSSSQPAAVAAAADGGEGVLSDSDIDSLDAASLRRLLASYGQPASGKISKLRERLKEVQVQQ